MFATLVTVALFAVRVLAADDIHLETPTFSVQGRPTQVGQGNWSLQPYHRPRR
jgi:hypothetical protein